MTGIVDYASLQAEVYAYLLRATTDRVVTPAQVQTYIQLCESKMNRELRIKLLEKTVPISANAASVALPTDFNAVINFDFVGGTNFDIEYYTKSNLNMAFGIAGPGQPQAYAIHGNSVFFGPVPDTAYPMVLDYYAKIPALSTANTSNVILAAYPDVYLYGSLSQAQLQIQDQDRLTAWAAEFSNAIQRIKDSDNMDRLPSGSRMRGRQNGIGGRRQ